MPAPIFMGDAVSAAGWRLAGVRTVVPESGQETAGFIKLLKETELLLLTAEVARELPETLLEKGLASVSPLVLVVPDVRGRVVPSDLSQQMQAQLGLGN